MTENQRRQAKDASLDAIAIITSAAHCRGRRPPNNEQYAKDLQALLRGKTLMELVHVIAALGDFGQVMVEDLARKRGMEPDELLQDIAMNIQRLGDEE